MTYPLITTDTIAPLPSAAGWIYTRSWHMTDHPQSGSEHSQKVNQFLLISEAAAWAEAERAGLHMTADCAILEEWINNGSVH